MNVTAIIPARMASSRFPGKPMAKIFGFPMIGHVYHRVRMCAAVTDTYVATCDQKIYEFIVRAGGKAVMTGDYHERCSERTAEALLKIEEETGKRADIVLMVQGDEPMVTPEMLEVSLEPFNDPRVQVVNLMEPIVDQAEHEDPNQVKVVTDLNNDALYFSREPIPSRKKGAKTVPAQKQVCIIPFRRDFLLAYIGMQPTPLEIVESVDMMRILEHGGRVRMVAIKRGTHAVDTMEDLKLVENLMKNDLLVEKYLAGMGI